MRRPAAIALALFACNERDPVVDVGLLQPVHVVQDRPAAASPGDRLAVVVVLDCVGTWAATPQSTPQLRRIVAAGGLDGHAWSPSSWTLPAVASMFTGLPASVHEAGLPAGATDWRRPLASGHRTLAETLKGLGWATHARVNHPFLATGWGLDQGFDGYDDADGTPEELVDAVLPLLEADGDRFVFVHLRGPYGPLVSSPVARDEVDGVPVAAPGEVLDPETRDLRTEHLGAVFELDREVGRLYDAARAASDDLLFLVTSAHGEEIGQHGGRGHGRGLHDEVLRVPWVVHPANASPDAPVLSTTSVSAVVRGFATSARPAPSTEPVVSTSSLFGPHRSVVRDGTTTLWHHSSLHDGAPRRFQLGYEDDPLDVPFWRLGQPAMSDEALARRLEAAHVLARHTLHAWRGLPLVVFGPTPEAPGRSRVFHADLSLDGGAFVSQPSLFAFPDAVGRDAWVSVDLEDRHLAIDVRAPAGVLAVPDIVGGGALTLTLAGDPAWPTETTVQTGSAWPTLTWTDVLETLAGEGPAVRIGRFGPLPPMRDAAEARFRVSEGLDP
jgi:hypothetical protein